MSIYLFCEGQTEKNIVEKLATLANPDFRGEGKGQVNKKMVDTLGPRLNLPESVRVLVMRDVDEGETTDSILQSVTGALQKMLQDRGFAHEQEVELHPHPDYPNVYLLTLINPDLRLALHLAVDKWNGDFINATIDDYVLTLALQRETVRKFLERKRWQQIQPEQIIDKVTEHIPALLQENGIPLREAKDYVRLYAAVIQEHTSPPVFASKTLGNASEVDKGVILAPLLAALGFLNEVTL